MVMSMVHLSMVLKLSSQPPHRKTSISFSLMEKLYKSPDLIAINNSNRYYGVFESKGYSTYSSNAMERGYIQAKSIDKINGKLQKFFSCNDRNRKENRDNGKDPEGGMTQIKVNLSFYNVSLFADR